MIVYRATLCICCKKNDLTENQHFNKIMKKFPSPAHISPLPIAPTPAAISTPATPASTPAAVSLRQSVALPIRAAGKKIQKTAHT